MNGRLKMTRTMTIMACAAAGVLTLAACSSSGKASSGTASAPGSVTTSGDGTSSGATGSPITLGYITSLTGPAASSYGKSSLAGAQARVDQANAAGGINGHMIKLESADDQSTPTGNATAAQSLIQTKKVFGIVSVGALAFAGAPYINKMRVPYIGDGNAPQYTQRGFDNMFSYQPPVQASVFNGKSYTWTDVGKFLKSIGVTKLATVQVNLPSTFSDATLASAASAGVTKCLENKSIPLGGVDFTATSLAIKNKGCNGVYSVLTSSSNEALAASVKSSGSKAKLLILGSYNPDTVATSQSSATFEDTWTLTPAVYDPAINPASKNMIDALVKYASPFKAGDVPSNGASASYLAVDLALKGLEVAGKNPTRQSFITNLQKVTDYTAGGILPSPTTFAHFGTADAIPMEHCDFFLQVKNGKFVDDAPGGKVCGTRISYTP